MTPGEFSSAMAQFMADLQAELRPVTDDQGVPLGDRVVLDAAAPVVGMDQLAVIVGAPGWTYDAFGPEPTNLTATVYVKGNAVDTDYLQRIMGLAFAVASALEASTVRDVVVMGVEPGSWLQGAVQHPAYRVRIESTPTRNGE